MKYKQLTAWIILTFVITLFLFTGIVSSASAITNLSIRITNRNENGKGKVIGNVLTEEANIPLAYGTIVIGEQKIEISNGKFELSDVKPGNYQIKLNGPFRETKQTMINIKPGDNQVTFHVGTHIEQAEIDMLARITRAEAEGESPKGQTAVAASILNRLLSSRYPSTVRAIVYQRISGRYQYSPVRDGRINLVPRQQDYEAAYNALAGNDPSYGATGFFNPAKTNDRWVRSNPVTTVIDGHTFFSY